MNNKVYRYAEGLKKMEHNGLVILGCIYNGMNFKMTRECYEILDEFMKSGMTVGELMNAFESEDDSKYFKEILDWLIEYKLIVESNVQEDYVITFELTNRCNLQCKHCCMEAVEVNSCKDPLSTQDWKNIIDKLVGLKINYIILSGGEPMIRPDFFEIAEYAKNTLKVPLQLMSNATLINESNADKLMELFIDFSFSLDGADEESCASIRGKGVFNKVMKSIDLLKKRGMDHFSLSFTKTKLNQDKLDKFFELCDELGAFPMERNFDFVGRATKNDYLLADDVDKQFEAGISEPSEDGHYYPEKMPMCISCGATKYKFVINHEGMIYPCSALLMSEFNMGNLNKVESIADFITERKFMDSEGYRLFEEMHPATSKYCNDCPVKLYCESCVLYSYLMRHRDNFDELCDKRKRDLMIVWN